MNCYRSRIGYFKPKWLLILCFTSILAACGGSGGGSSDTPAPTTPPPPSPSSTTINGNVIKGPLAGATVNVFAVDASGVKTGDPIDTTTTDANGQYTINLGSYTGVYIVEATGGSYTDEATGKSLTVAADSPLRAVSSVDSASAGTTIIATVTPLTEIAVQVAQSKTGGLTTDNVADSNNEVGALFFGDAADAGDRLLTTVPADVVNEDSANQTDDERLYGLLIGTISALDAQVGGLAEALAIISTDIADDGNLADVAADLITASETFINSATNNSGISSTDVISNIITAAIDNSPVPDAIETDITAFVFDTSIAIQIDTEIHAVAVLLPFGTDISAIGTPTIATSLGSTIAAEAGEDFSAAVTYLVTAEDGTTSQQWTVLVTIAPTDQSPLADILGASNDLITSSIINKSSNRVIISVSTLVDLSSLANVTDLSLLFSISTGASITESSGSILAGDVSYLITAEDGTTNATWQVTLTVSNPETQPAFSITNGNLSLSTSDTTVQLSVSGGLDNLPVTFSSSDSSVASVDPTTGLVIVVAAGTATITANKPGSSSALVTYLPIEATIELTITAPTPPGDGGGGDGGGNGGVTDCVLDQSTFDSCTLL